MTWNWFTDGIPWRFLVIRRNYFRNIRIAHVCPEIRGEVNRNAFLLSVSLWVYVPLAIILAPFFLMRWVSDAVLDMKALRIFPHFERLRQKSVLEANAKIPPEEVRRRLGETYPRLLRKKGDI